MAVDGKYGRVTTEFGNIGEDEPVIVFRAQDKMLLKVLLNYYRICLTARAPRRHLDAIMDAMEKVREWQRTHSTQLPASEGYTPNQGWENK